jgi:hypothetical protein
MAVEGSLGIPANRNVRVDARRFRLAGIWGSRCRGPLIRISGSDAGPRRRNPETHEDHNFGAKWAPRNKSRRPGHWGDGCSDCAQSARCGVQRARLEPHAGQSCNAGSRRRPARIPPVGGRWGPSVSHHAGRRGCREKRDDWARLARLASGHQVPFVDAPVSGSIEPAERGELLWLERVGDGSRLKLAINNWLGVLVEGMAETISLSTALGLDPRLFLHAIAAGPLASEYAIAKGDAMLQADFVAGFPLQHAMKDAGLASSAAHQRGVELPLTEAMLPRWQHAITLGHGADDIASAVAAAGKIADAS